MPPLLEVADAHRVYSLGSIFSRHRLRAVDGVSFTMEAEKPEIFTIVGESGSGKTTLARMILNMVSPSSGVIRFRGQDLSRIRGGQARLAFMKQVQPIFQNPFEAFNPLKKIDRYLFMTARHIAGLTVVAEIEAAADEALRNVGLSLGEIRGRYPHELSGGQLQRVAIARALATRPDLVFADEPTGNLDSRTGREVLAILADASRESGQSIAMVTHDPIAASHADRILFLADGRIVRDAARSSAEEIATYMLAMERAA
jgi:ABC-type glutathione transport system ATPase component